MAHAEYTFSAGCRMSCKSSGPPLPEQIVVNAFANGSVHLGQSTKNHKHDTRYFIQVNARKNKYENFPGRCLLCTCVRRDSTVQIWITNKQMIDTFYGTIRLILWFYQWQSTDADTVLQIQFQIRFRSHTFLIYLSSFLRRVRRYILINHCTWTIMVEKNGTQVVTYFCWVFVTNTELAHVGVRDLHPS